MVENDLGSWRKGGGEGVVENDLRSWGAEERERGEGEGW